MARVSQGVDINSIFVEENNISTTSPTPQSERMWSTYKKTFEEHDKRITEAWKYDAAGLLTFTGLFSAIVGLFIIESYKKLSPDPNDRTVALLGKISQQLAGAGFTNGTSSDQPASQDTSHPSAAIIAVNILWLTSLVLSVTSALFATSLQQWARRFIEMPLVRNTAVETIPALLHLSVLLFFTGLVTFFFTIHQKVAITVSVVVGTFGVIYLILTAVPYFKYDWPYRTPISDIWWYLWNSSLSLLWRFLHWAVGWIPFAPDTDRDDPQDLPWTQRMLFNWLENLKGAYKRRWDCATNGFKGVIIQGAIDAPVDVDRDALIRTFNQLALVDRRKLLKFMASIPNDEVIRIMTPPFMSRPIIFCDSLLTLIESSAVETSVHGLDESERTNCLLVWSNAILRVLFVTSQDELEELFYYLLLRFAKSSHMKTICAHPNIAIRLTSLSICALLAKWILRQRRFFAPEKFWLEDMLCISLDENGKLDNDVILRFLVCGTLRPQEGNVSSQAEETNIPDAHIVSFTETLAIIMDARTHRLFCRITFTHELSYLFHQLKDSDIPVADGLVTPGLFTLYPFNCTRTTAFTPTPALKPEPLSNKLRR